jgi:hypothetical protein
MCRTYVRLHHQQLPAAIPPLRHRVLSHRCTGDPSLGVLYLLVTRIASPYGSWLQTTAFFGSPQLEGCLSAAPMAGAAWYLFFDLPP